MKILFVVASSTYFIQRTFIIEVNTLLLLLDARTCHTVRPVWETNVAVFSRSCQSPCSLVRNGVAAGHTESLMPGLDAVDLSS